MRNRVIVGVALLLVIFLCTGEAHALSARHHVINASRDFGKAILAPFKGVLWDGPIRVRDTFRYEVWGREKESERGKTKYFAFAMWRAPGDELKGAIDGVSTSVNYLGSGLKEFLSVFFSD